MREVFAEPIAELKELLELIEGGLNRPETKPTCTDLEEAVMGHWGRAVAVSIGVLHLCEHSYGDLALTLTRTLREILASAAWLLVDPAEEDARAERFWRYAVLEVSHEGDLAARVGWARTVEETRRINPEFLRNYGRSSSARSLAGNSPGRSSDLSAVGPLAEARARP